MISSKWIILLKKNLLAADVYAQITFKTATT